MGKALELVHIPARLEAEAFDDVERYVLAQNRNVERLGFLNELAGIIRLIDGDDHLVRLVRDLHKGIVDHAVIFRAVVSRHDVKPVADLEKSIFIHFVAPLFFDFYFRRNRFRRTA